MMWLACQFIATLYFQDLEFIFYMKLIVLFFLLPQYQVCFFRQFFGSVTKVDYMTLRHGFIMVRWEYTLVLESFHPDKEFSLFELQCLVIFYRHIWPLEVKQDLTSKSTSADHLMRILKLWWESGVFSQSFEP
jgi:hypothetical protein